MIIQPSFVTLVVTKFLSIEIRNLIHSDLRPRQIYR